jgi:hypothetical protein
MLLPREAIEDVVADAAEHPIIEFIAVARRITFQKTQVLDVGPESVGRERCRNAIAQTKFAAKLDDLIADIIDHIGVALLSSNHRIGAGAAIEDGASI